MMGNPNEVHQHNGGGGGGGGQGGHHGHHNSRPQQTKATFSGMTALTAIVALLLAIISAAVPNWGHYSPQGSSYLAAGFSTQDSRGHFGPFQVCRKAPHATFCDGNRASYKATTWLTIAGVCSVLLVVCLAGMALFSVLHVAMQLQRREIMVSFQRAVFLKLILSSIATLLSLMAVIFGALEFRLTSRTSHLRLETGVCYYLQIVLIFIDVILIVLSYLSYKRAKSHPPHMVPKSRDNGYDAQNSNGISMTAASGAPPYSAQMVHGQPRQPIHQHPYSPSVGSSTISSYMSNTSPPINYQFQYNANAAATLQHQQQLPQQAGPQVPVTSAAIQEGVSSNGGGFTTANLVVPPASSVAPVQPLQPLRPIQPVQPIQLPQMSQGQNSNGGSGGRVHLGGVSFQPEGRKHQQQQGASVASAAGHGGSMESLNSTQSLTLSQLSFGSTASTGSGTHGPLRSSLKKPKQKDVASVSSKTSSKQVRISLGQEQTAL